LTAENEPTQLLIIQIFLAALTPLITHFV